MDTSERAWIAGRRRDLAVAVVTVVIVLVAAFAGWQSWRTQQDLRALVTCQVQVNNDLRRAILARDAAGTAQLQAQLELLTTPRGDPQRGIEALARFVDQLRATLANREANPFPTRNC